MKQLAQALVKAQSKFQAAKKSTVNPFHKSKYADLESVWEAVQGPLAEEGLAISQTFRHESDNIYLITHLIHVSGEMFTSEIPVVAIKKDPQGYGSAITYFRRYSLQSILCLVTSDDDDGEAASGRRKEEEVKPQPQVKPKSNDRKTLGNSLKELWSTSDLEELSKELFGILNPAELTNENLKEMLKIVERFDSYQSFVSKMVDQSLN